MHSTAELCARCDVSHSSKALDLQEPAFSSSLESCSRFGHCDCVDIETQLRTVEAVAATSQLLSALVWPAAHEAAFLQERVLPEPVYDVNRAQAEANLVLLAGVQIDAQDPMGRVLGRIAESYALANRMLLALGTKAFHQLSVEAYGGARHGRAGVDQVAFAEHLEARLGLQTRKIATPLTANDLAADIEARRARSGLALECRIEVVPSLASKVIAGSTRMRIRADAVFGKEEARGLYCHEVETHLLTAQNGAHQERMKFLRIGGPRTTRTQEGLAVFSEFYGKAMTSERLRRLIMRVKLVDMAERGADFVELVKHLEDAGSDPREAYNDAVRVCRGGLVTGGAPFTKDVVYLAGLVDVHRFLAASVSSGNRKRAELLIAGRIDLSDIPDLEALQTEGILSAPKFEPYWLRNWDDLLTHFAVTSFLS
jgi:uncharacterized protein (TIGR02421 family)